MQTAIIILSLFATAFLAGATAQKNGTPRPAVTSRIRPHFEAVQRTGVPCLPSMAWFRVAPSFFASCASGVIPRIGAERCVLADVDGNGDLESFDVECFGALGTRCIVDGSAFEEDAARRVRLSLVHINAEERDVRLEGQLVFQIDSMAVGQALLRQFPGLANALVLDPRDNGLYAGWADADRDGDKDLVLQFFADYGDGSSSLEGQIWFENIGHEKPAPPVAADINRDGQVNGADLGILLTAWGPDP